MEKQEKSPGDIASLISNMKKQSKLLGAAEVHVVSGQLDGEEHSTAVISVYDGVKPSHIILDELYEWAEENNKEVAEKIEQLSEL